MIATPENLRRLLDIIVEKPNLTAAMRAIGSRGDNTIFLWLKKSAAGDPNFVLSWPNADDEPRPFHEHLATARRMFCVLYDATLRSDVLLGTQETVIVDGRICYREDPRFIGLSDDDMAFLGYSESARIFATVTATLCRLRGMFPRRHI